MKNLLLAIFGIGILILGIFLFLEKRQVAYLGTTLAAQQQLLVQKENALSQAIPTQTTTAIPPTPCDAARAYVAAAPGSLVPSFQADVFCGADLGVPFETSIGSFVVRSKDIQVKAKTPGADPQTISMDVLYSVKGGNEIEVPLNYTRPTGAIAVPQIESVIDFHDRVLLIRLKGTSAISFVGIDLTKGSNSTPISVDTSEVVGGKKK